MPRLAVGASIPPATEEMGHSLQVMAEAAAAAVAATRVAPVVQEVLTALRIPKEGGQV